MSDPISILGAVAAASQVIEQAAKLAMFFSELYGKVQDAPELVRKQSTHIEQLMILSRLVKENPSLQTELIASVLRSCLKTAELLLETLTKISIEEGDGKLRKLQKISLALTKEKRITASLADLEREKNSLILCIQEIDSKLLYDLHLSVDEVKSEVSQVSLVVKDTALDMKGVAQSIPEISANVKDMHEILPNLAREVHAIMRFSLTKRRSTFNTTAPGPESQAPVKGLYMVPNRRVRGFIGREDILGRIEEGFSSEGRPCIMVLRAMGGQGKTQVALEYCQRAKHQRFKAIFWVDATSETTLRKNFRTIAERLKPPELIIEDDASVDLVLEKLGELLDPWLMVFDNYDDPVAFNNLQEYMAGEDGCFLITTRHADTDAITDPENVIELPGLDERSALDLLFQQSQIKETEANFEEGRLIVDRLGFHPLAITQAGSYMKLRKIKLHDFLAHYKRQRKSILQQTPQMSQYRRKLNNADTETALNVFTTWELSFQQLLATEGSDANTKGKMKSDLLTLFAFFDCKDISEELFRDFCCSSKLQEIKSSTGPSSSLGLLLDEFDKWDGDKFAEFLVDLNQHALLQTWSRESDDFCHFSLHPLTKDWILLRADLGSFQKYYTTAAEIVAVFLEARYSHENFTLPLSVQQSILSHVDSLLEQKHNEKWDEKTSLELFRQVNQSELWFARLFFLSGRYNEAEEVTLKILEFREREMGLEHELTLVALEEESKSLSRKGKDDEAIEMDRRRIRGCEKIYGTKDIRTFQAYNSLFSGLIEVELLVEAEALYMNHLKEFEELFGLEHPETLKCRINKGNLVRNQGRPAEAEIVYRGAIDATSKVYGPKHAFTFEVRQHLAMLQFHLGKYLESENMFRELVEDRQRALGLDHPEILLSQTMVAWMLFKQDKGLEAEVLLREMVSQSNRILGPDDTWSLQIGNLLGLTLYHFERYDEAEVFFRDAADRSRRVLGMHNANCLQLLFHLGRVRHKKGQTDDALKLLEEVAEQREKTLGADNVATSRAKDVIADILYDVGENAKAASIYRDIAEQRKKTLGPDHPDTLVAQNDQAACLYRENKYNEAAELWEHVLHRREVSLDPEHLDTARSRANLASTYMKLKRYMEAEKLFSLAYEQRKRLLGPEAERTLDCQASLANALYALTRYDKSAKVYESLAELSRRVYGPEHGDTRQTLFRYAQAQQALGKYEESENLYREVLSAETKVLGLEKATTLQTVAYVAKILRLQEKNIEADEFMDQLTARLESALDAATDKDFIQIFQRVGEELFEEEDFVHAEAIFRQVAASQEKAFGEVAGTFSRLAWVGKALYAQGKYSKAAETYKMLLERSEKLLGAESETTVSFVWDLGNALRKDRKYTDADPLYRRLLDTLGKKAKVDEAELLKARGQYAALLRDQGLALVEKENWSGAEEFYRGILEQGKLIDLDTEITIEALAGLGKILQKQERWVEVYDVYKRALDLREKSLRGKKNRRKRRALQFRQVPETIAAMGRGEDVWKNILELRPKHSTEQEDF